MPVRDGEGLLGGRGQGWSRAGLEGGDGFGQWRLDEDLGPPDSRVRVLGAESAPRQRSRYDTAVDILAIRKWMYYYELIGYPKMG
jgi:hypothetical protein